jgi:hypothetical protein
MSKTTTDAQKSTERYGIGRGRIESKNNTNTNTSDYERERLQDQCRSCERELASRIARVCGDNDGCVPVCDECAPTVSETRRNTAAIAHAHRNKTSTAGNNCSTPLFTQQNERGRGGDE